MPEKNKSRKILIVDDDSGVITSLTLLLKQAGYSVRDAFSPEAALKILASESFDLLLQDMNFTNKTSGEDGLKLLSRIKADFPHLPVILMTAWGSVSLAVRGVKMGASDFITKPWSNEQILHAVRTALGLAEINRKSSGETLPTRPELDRRCNLSEIVGQDPKFLKILDIVSRISATDAPVLITGESGTGKELIANAIWRNSDRQKAPFVKVNLGGIPASLFESEMFGHVKGAFTDAKFDRIGRFEAANKGTIFLDEIGDLDPICQVKLLRVLQDRTFERVGSSKSQTVDIRVISATNKNLAEMIESGTFREDLFYRMNLITIRLPSLRERASDIPLLSNAFLKKVSKEYNREHLPIAEDAVDWLMTQHWPGNIRQLHQLIERTVLLSSSSSAKASSAIGRDDFLLAYQMQSSETSKPAKFQPGEMTLDEIEKEMILKAGEDYNGNISRIASVLGLSRSALYRRLKKHGIDF